MSYLAKNYNRKKISFKRGKGSFLYSVDGKKYFDLYMDPVDMRIAVDSEESLTEAGFNTFIRGREEDSCMSDVFELIK